MDANNEKLTTAVQWVHSCRVRSEDRDFVSVKEKHITINEKNEIVKSEDVHRIIPEPSRRIWVTKPAFRNHTNKKESERIDRTDAYQVKDKDLIFGLKKILGLGYMKHYMSLKKLCNSPYVYGADINMEALVRLRYKEKAAHQVIGVSTGAYDHEQSVLGCDRINAITVVLGKQVYTAVLKDFTHNNIDESGKQFTSDRNMMLDYSKKVLKPYIHEHDFTLNMEVFETEVEMFKYIFAAIHKHKTDFIGIWNIDYDIPSLMERCEVNGVSYEDIAHHPEIDQKYKFSHYRADKRQVAHITDKWPWLHNVGFTQFYDAMLTHARIRKNQTKEPSYTLDAISSKVIGTGKLEFEGQSDHYDMQSKHFMKYVAYNIADALLIQLMTWKTHDVEALLELTSISPLYDFSKQTTMLKDQLYAYYLENGRVLGSAGADVEELHAKMLSKVGGTVLSPYLIKKVGLRAIDGYPGVETLAFAHCFDADYASIYPSAKISFNISKETKLSTIVAVDGDKSPAKIERLCGGLANPMENAVPICSEFLGLPSYAEMRDLFEHYYSTEVLRR